ncbi:hypothetical protein [Rhodoferax ferrireducens]|uniref:hypothetical protein n=1 Tax=Rhodoferax ferrireducens TaxID=192843 RepID=UPI003BB6A0F0
MKLGGKSKADLRFGRNRPFGAGARNSEAVTQRRKPVFLFLGRQRSVTRQPRTAGSWQSNSTISVTPAVVLIQTTIANIQAA